MSPCFFACCYFGLVGWLNTQTLHNGDCHFFLTFFWLEQVCACLPFVTCQADLDETDGRFGKTVLHFMGMNRVSTKEKKSSGVFTKSLHTRSWIASKTITIMKFKSYLLVRSSWLLFFFKKWLTTSQICTSLLFF